MIVLIQWLVSLLRWSLSISLVWIFEWHWKYWFDQSGFKILFDTILESISWWSSWKNSYFHLCKIFKYLFDYYFGLNQLFENFSSFYTRFKYNNCKYGCLLWLIRKTNSYCSVDFKITVNININRKIIFLIIFYLSPITKIYICTLSNL